ncbi:MAG: DsrE family protein [Xanthobacteraceae bacterium]
MHRRNIITAAFRIACATPPISAMAVAQARAEQERAAAARLAAAEYAKVAYHLSDLDKVDFVLGNIRNHYAGMGGPDHVTIVLVIHGPALKAFHLAAAAPDVTKNAEELKNVGLQLNACINTMRAQKVTLKDLLPGFIVAEKGAVVRLAELQSQGYSYLRP